MRKILLIVSMLGFAAAAHAQSQFKVGEVVLGSPYSSMSLWRRCVILTPINSNGVYGADCAEENTAGKYVQRTTLKPDWVKPNDPSFRPDMQVAAIKAAEERAAAPKPAAPVVKTSATPPLGYYACGSRSGYNPIFSPTLLAGGRYRVTYNIGGTIHDTYGNYSYDPESKLVRFEGGEFDGLAALYGAVGTALSAYTQTLDWPTLIWPKSDGTYPAGMYCPNKGTQNPISQTP